MSVCHILNSKKKKDKENQTLAGGKCMKIEYTITDIRYL